MAILGKNNIIEMARSHKAPYWRLYESEHKRTSGNYIATADFESLNLGVENSLEILRKALDTLTPGRYIFVAYKDNNTKKGGIDSYIEVESNGQNAAVSGIGSAAEFYMEGIGKVTADNFEEAIEKKMEKMQEKLRKEQEDKMLRDEVATLRKQVSENEAGINKGLMTIGTIAYGMMSETPKGKEFIGMARQALFATNKITAAPGDQPRAEALGSTGENTDINDERMIGALERLAKDNPDILGQLEKLADLKENDPGTFEMAVSSLN